MVKKRWGHIDCNYRAERRGYGINNIQGINRVADEPPISTIPHHYIEVGKPLAVYKSWTSSGHGAIELKKKKI